MQQQSLKVEVKPEDFRNAPHGYSRPRCPLEIAIQRMYPDTYVFVGHDRAAVGKLPDQVRYKIDLDLWGGEKSPWPADKITELSKRAKESLEGIPTVSLTLEPWELKVVTLPGLHDPIVI